jgi:hypothetical protein
VDLTQPTSIRNQGAFFPEIHETVFDRLTMIDQQQQEQLDRSLHIPSGSSANTELPPPAANSFIAWDVTGRRLINVPALTPSAEALQVNLATPGPGQGANLVGYKAPFPGAVSRTDAAKNADTYSVGDAGIVSDGVTDQTSALLSLFTALTAASWRGVLLVPYGTKFTVRTVYAAIPSGVTLRDESSINFGHPPTYVNKFTLYVTSDTVSDDSSLGVVSGHHAALRILNMGTSGTASGDSRYSSILFDAGLNTATASKDIITGFQQIQAKASGKNVWRMSFVLHTPFSAATGKEWSANTAYPAGTVIYTSASYIYSTVNGGTSGSHEPSGTTLGGTEVDGTVTWICQGVFDKASTLFYVDEDGIVSFANFLNQIQEFHLGSGTAAGGNYEVYFKTDGTAKSFALYDKTNSRNILSRTPTGGFQVNTQKSQTWQTLSGATPTLSESFSAGYVNNSGATNMTNMLMAGSMTEGDIMLMFANANTTLIHSSSLQCKGAANVTPPAGGFMRFIKNSSHSGGWIEVSRSF